jgi:hypothetical protein
VNDDSFLRSLPPRPESCIDGARLALEQDDAIVRQTVSSLEAPSAVAAVRDAFPNAMISFSQIPTPDPRLPARDVPFALWRYDDTEASPGVPPPDARVVALVESIATRTYDLESWSNAARDGAAGLAANVTASDCLAAMVHPPSGPPGILPWDFRFRVQVAAALVAAHLEERRDGPPFAVLFDAIDGPLDWACTAAIVALLDRARRIPSEGREVAKYLLDLVHRPMSPIAFMSVAFPAVVACRDIPGLAPGDMAAIERLYERLCE